MHRLTKVSYIIHRASPLTNRILTRPEAKSLSRERREESGRERREEANREKVRESGRGNIF